MQKEKNALYTEDTATTGSLFINLPVKTYRCSKGHIWKGNSESRLNIWQEDAEVGHYAFCPFCYIEWFRQNISELKEIE